MSITPSTEVMYLKGVGPRRAELLAKRGIRTFEDLLGYLPFRAIVEHVESVPAQALDKFSFFIGDHHADVYSGHIHPYGLAGRNGSLLSVDARAKHQADYQEKQ